ncbi:lytic murein transglycosylase [Lysobacter pythonis]|uniref:Lytic murein transglycosylase n=1 Tax=Solilutibacter pythonis TaxID=2483112 RepID=A0A3M2HMX7_9GAMM|nr:lytic murein transglycosylase [Lysobacter pythonis]RMH87627.1 lytic murein transglycosylase [Lysobacter pythonis]
MLVATPPSAPPATVAPSEAELARFGQCVAGLRAPAIAAGVAAAAFDRHLPDVTPDMSVLPLLNRQPEFVTPLWDYLAMLVDARRIREGRERLARHADLLRQVEARYGVDPATVVAVWGVESDYGQNFGRRPLLQSLATLACFGRRQPFFRSELYEVLKIVQRGDVAVDDLRGSWAGAFGHTQFMPSTYNRIAVDFDGDGRRDLVGSIPDALGSTAHYLVRSGWRGGQPWGHEVKLPAGFNVALAGRTQRKPLREWRALGVARIDGVALDLPPDTRAAVLAPAGVAGPAFLVFKNYDAIHSYNAAESYALAIALLADALRGAPGLATPWPTDDPGLGRDERMALQRLLAARGHAIGHVDGVLGRASREAIRREQARLGWPQDGRAGLKLLNALRQSR